MVGNTRTDDYSLDEQIKYEHEKMKEQNAIKLEKLVLEKQQAGDEAISSGEFKQKEKYRKKMVRNKPRRN